MKKCHISLHISSLAHLLILYYLLVKTEYIYQQNKKLKLRNNKTIKI